MPTLTDVRTTWSQMPLGAGRGGSGATKVDLLVVTVTDDEGDTGSGFTYALTGGADGVHALLEGTVRDQVRGTELSRSHTSGNAATPAVVSPHTGLVLCAA